MIKPCGICDHCINEKLIHISTEEFNSINNRVLEIIKEGALPVDEILVNLKGIKKEKIWKVIEYLLAEDKILADQDGNIALPEKQDRL